MKDNKELFEQTVDKLRDLRARMIGSNADVASYPEEVANSHRAWLKDAFKSGKALGLTIKEIVKEILSVPASA